MNAYSYERTAGTVKFGPDDVEQMRKDVLLLMKNVDRTESFDDARKFREGVNTWVEWYRERLYEHLMPNIEYAVRKAVTGSDKWTDEPYFQEQIEKWVKFWDKKLRTPTWDLYIALREMPMSTTHLMEKYQQVSAEDAKRSIFDKWTSEKKKWSDRVKRVARGAWTALGEFLTWLTNHKVEMERTHREVTQQRMEGFSVRIVGFERGENFSQQSLTKFETALRMYRQRASQVLPILIKGQLPIEFNLACKVDQGGRYEGDHIKVCAVLDDPKGYVRIIAHEMGHHLWGTYVSADMQRFWRDALRGDYTDLDLHDLLDVWKNGESHYTLIDRLKHEDPILSLQFESLLADYGGSTFKWRNREDLVRYLNEGNSANVKVPANPITEYANKNEEEAFCEVVGYLVAYGPRAVTQTVRGWFNTILPGYYREASIEQRVAARFARCTDKA